MIIQKEFMLVLTMMMLASCVADDEKSFIKFKNGLSKKVEIVDWRRNGIEVIGRVRKELYYYVEIESINGTLLADMKSYKAFRKLWSKVSNRMKISMGFNKKKQVYDKYNNIFKDERKRKLCKDSKRETIIKAYNKKGNLIRERTCVRGEPKIVKDFYKNGAVKNILYFTNNEVIAVERFY